MPIEITGFLILSLIIVLVAVVFASQGIKVVPQQTAWVVERLGKFHAVLSPGLNFIIPFIDRVAYRHSLKEIPLDTPSQVCITRDNTQLTVDGVLFFQVTDPQRASYGAGQAIVTPSVIRGELVALYRQLELSGIVENADLFKQYLIVERNADNPNRLDVLFPPDLVNQLRIFAVLNQFRLQYAEE